MRQGEVGISEAVTKELEPEDPFEYLVALSFHHRPLYSERHCLR